MGFPAARVGDMHICPMVTPGVPPVPHVGGPILPPGTPTVFIGGMPAAVVGNMCTCVGPPDSIVKGSLGVFICGMPAARMGDMTAHGGTIVMGCPTVFIGDMGGKTISFKLYALGKPTKEYYDKYYKEDVKIYDVSAKNFKENILPALNEAEKVVDDKIKQLEKWDDAEKERFKRAFGDHKELQDAAKDDKLIQIRNMKKLISELKEGKEAKFKFARTFDPKTKKEKKDTFAWVNSEDTDNHIVNLAFRYHDADLTGENSKMGTILHEISHFKDIANTNDETFYDEETKEDTTAYGVVDAKKLIFYDKEKALNNADNLEFYLEGAFEEKPGFFETLFGKKIY